MYYVSLLMHILHLDNTWTYNNANTDMDVYLLDV